MPTEDLDDIPRIQLFKVIDKLEIIRRTVGTDSTTREVAAETLDMSAKGGGFTRIVSTLEKYGFIETVWGGKILVTTLGKEVIYGSEDEKEEARLEAFFNIMLFKKIYKRYGYGATEDQIRTFLRQEAYVDIAQAEKKAMQAFRIYRSFIDTITPERLSHHLVTFTLSEDTTNTEFKKETKSPKDIEIPKAEEDDFVIQFGRVFIRLPQNDLAALALAKQSIEMMEELIKKKMQDPT